MSFKQRLTNLQNVAPGNTATLKVPTGANAPTLDKIIVELSGTLDTADIESIRGKANGKLFFDEITGTIVNKRRAYKGIATSVSYLILDFTEPNARNGAVEQLVGTIPLSQLQDLSFEFKLAAGAPVNGRMEAEMHYRQPTRNPFIQKLLNTTASFAASGEQIIYLPTGGAGGKLKRVWIHEQTPGTITEVEMRVGNTTAWETNRNRLEKSQIDNELVPQAGIVVLDFIEDGNLSGIIDTGNSANVELRIDSSAANTYQVFYELIDPIGRL